MAIVLPNAAMKYSSGRFRVMPLAGFPLTASCKEQRNLKSSHEFSSSLKGSLALEDPLGLAGQLLPH